MRFPRVEGRSGRGAVLSCSCSCSCSPQNAPSLSCPLPSRFGECVGPLRALISLSRSALIRSCPHSSLDPPAPCAEDHLQPLAYATLHPRTYTSCGVCLCAGAHWGEEDRWRQQEKRRGEGRVQSTLASLHVDVVSFTRSCSSPFLCLAAFRFPLCVLCSRVLPLMCRWRSAEGGKRGGGAIGRSGDWEGRSGAEMASAHVTWGASRLSLPSPPSSLAHIPRLLTPPPSLPSLHLPVLVLFAA